MYSHVPDSIFVNRVDGKFESVSSRELFEGKRVVVFGLPGAFTPTCSEFQLPGFDTKYNEFTSLGIDAIYCVSVNDGFVMNAWAKELGILNVQLLADGNCSWTDAIGMAVQKQNLGFGRRSWRYAVVINDNEVEKWFVESGKADDCATDPYEESTPEKVLEYLQS
jgi:peroxiredoxin